MDAFVRKLNPSLHDDSFLNCDRDASALFVGQHGTVWPVLVQATPHDATAISMLLQFCSTCGRYVPGTLLRLSMADLCYFILLPSTSFGLLYQIIYAAVCAPRQYGLTTMNLAQYGMEL